MIDHGDETILKWLSIAARVTNTELTKRLKPLGLKSSQYFYILKIKDNPGITQDQLMEVDFLNPSNVTRALNQLEQARLVIKERDPNDRRRFVMSLTTAGEQLYPEIQQIVHDMENTLAEKLASNNSGIIPERVITSLRKLSN